MEHADNDVGGNVLIHLCESERFLYRYVSKSSLFMDFYMISRGFFLVMRFTFGDLKRMVELLSVNSGAHYLVDNASKSKEG